MQVNIDSSNHSTINTEISVPNQTNTTKWTFERYGSIMDWIMSYDQASIPFMSNKVSAVRNNLTCRQYMQWLHNGSTIIYENADLHKPVEERTIKEVYYNDYIHDMSNAYTKCDRVLLLHRATSSGVRFITLDCDDSSIVDEYPDEDQRFHKAVSMMPDELRKIAFFTKSRNKKLPHAHIQVFNQLQYECIYSIINCLTFWNNKGDILMAGSWEANARTTDMFVCSDNELGLERHMELREFNCTYDRKPRVTYTSSMSYGIIPDIDFTTLLKWTNEKGKQFIEKVKEKNNIPKQIRDKDRERISDDADANDLFSIFKRSKYYVASAGFEIVTIDNSENRVILKAPNVYYCNICNREHINNSNRTYIFRTNNIVGYYCRTRWEVLVSLNTKTVFFRNDDSNENVNNKKYIDENIDSIVKRIYSDADIDTSIDMNNINWIEPDGTDITYSRIFYNIYKDRFMYHTGIGKWYEVTKNNTWIQTTQISIPISNGLRYIVNKHFRNCLEQTKKNGKNDIDTKLLLKYERWYNYVGSKSGTSNITHFLMRHECFGYASKYIDFDEKPNLFAFPNGTLYDLTTKQFRAIHPSDHITLTTAISVTESDMLKLTVFENGKYVDSIMDELVNTLKSILIPFGNNEVYKQQYFGYIMKHYSKSLYGRNTDETYDIWVGRGRNGKSTICDLFKNSLGTNGYFQSVQPEIFTRTISDRYIKLDNS